MIARVHVVAPGNRQTIRVVSSTYARVIRTGLSGGSGGGSSNVAALDDLTDVTISSPATNDALTYNGSAWVNQSAFSSQSVALASGASSGTVTFPAAQSTDSWKLDALYIENDTDASPVCLVASVTSKSTTGFTFKLNGSTDSANYVLVYRLAGFGGSSATIDTFARKLAIAALALGRH